MLRFPTRTKPRVSSDMSRPTWIFETTSKQVVKQVAKNQRLKLLFRKKNLRSAHVGISKLQLNFLEMALPQTDFDLNNSKRVEPNRFCAFSTAAIVVKCQHGNVKNLHFRT